MGADRQGNDRLLARQEPMAAANDMNPGLAMQRRMRGVFSPRVAWALVVLLVLLAGYRFLDPLPPRRLTIAAGPAGGGFDIYARRYAQILGRNGVQLEVRNFAGSVEHFDALRDPGAGVQAAITAFGFTEPDDAQTLYSLGGISDSPIFVFYRGAQTITRLADLRGKRLSIGSPTTAMRSLLTQALDAAGALDPSVPLADLGFAQAIDALIAGDIDVAMIAMPLDDELLPRALHTPGVRLMNVPQAEAISKSVPGLKHIVLWRGMVSLAEDIPATNVDLLASRTRVLVRQDLHPALQYLLLEAMRTVHSPAGAFNHLGEFPAQQPGDLPLSPVAEAFYRSGPSFWQRYTTFWLSSLLDRIVFFVIPVLAMTIPLIGFAPRIDRWLHMRRIDRLHRALGDIQRELARSPDGALSAGCVARLAAIESAARSMKVAPRFDADLQRLRIHLRMAREDLAAMGTTGAAATAAAAQQHDPTLHT